MRIAVIGDIHANATALRAALRAVDAAGADRLVFLGDLLTYGADVAETIDLVGARLVAGSGVLLRGNHDQVYEDLLKGTSDYANALPDWVRESVDWTVAHIPTAAWAKLGFVDELVMQRLLVSHANPYGSGNWTYLNTLDDHARAASALQERSLRAGIFGHTHRIRWFSSAHGFHAGLHGTLSPETIHVLNGGSIGQPRDMPPRSPHILWVTIGAPDAAPHFSFDPFTYDVQAHLEAVTRSGLSAPTTARLHAYFQPS